jgi:hypothetical protein
MASRTVVVVEDVYARSVLEAMLRRLAGGAPRVIHLMPCSNKMERVIRGHLADGRKVVVLLDAESQDPRERERWLREAHRLDSRVEVNVFDPCIEAAACEALGLHGCRDRPCKNGPILAVDAYWRRTGRGRYRKRLLGRLLREAEKTGSPWLVPEMLRLLSSLGVEAEG